VPAGDPSANRQSADQPQIVTLSLAHNVTRGTEVDHGHDAIAGAADSHDRRMRAGRTNCTHGVDEQAVLTPARNRRPQMYYAE
jgi:hypothetical protein